ncbi:MAG: DUF1592 domain-containing protein [Polyangiaceae bacterium]
MGALLDGGQVGYHPGVANLRRLLVGLTLSGCVGLIDDPPSGGSTGPGTDPGDPRLEARVWRLTDAQYNREIQRFFPGAPVVDVPDGASEYGLTNIASTARIDLGNASLFHEAARTIGTWVADQGAPTARCQTFGTPACVDTFMDWFPEAAFRRPPTPAERAELRAVYDELEPKYGADWAFAALVRGVLLSPQFLYRYEIGPSGKGIVKLDDYEIASLISFSLTDGAPDQELLDAAKAGTLRDASVREKHARRLMGRTGPVWQRFFWEWLKMSTLQSQGTETQLDPNLVAGLEEESRTFIQKVIVDNAGTLGDLLTSTTSWGNSDVANYYGASHPGGGLAQFELPAKERGGLLTLGAWLVSHGKKGRDNVVRRGMGLFRDAMCQEIKPLNIDLEAATKALVGADATIKEIADARGADATCGACHVTSDPIGLVFESYAGDGKFQTTYADGKPVEATAVMDGVSYENAMQVSARLAEDDLFRRCLVQRFGHFVMGAEFGSPVEVRAPAAAYDAFVSSGGSFEELLVAIVRDAAFIERRK